MKKVFWKKMMKMIVIILLIGIIIGFCTGAKRISFVEKMHIMAQEAPEIKGRLYRANNEVPSIEINLSQNNLTALTASSTITIPEREDCEINC